MSPKEPLESPVAEVHAVLCLSGLRGEGGRGSSCPDGHLPAQAEEREACLSLTNGNRLPLMINSFCSWTCRVEWGKHRGSHWGCSWGSSLGPPNEKQQGWFSQVQANHWLLQQTTFGFVVFGPCCLWLLHHGCQTCFCGLQTLLLGTMFSEIAVLELIEEFWKNVLYTYSCAINTLYLHLSPFAWLRTHGTRFLLKW